MYCGVERRCAVRSSPACAYMCEARALTLCTALSTDCSVCRRRCWRMSVNTTCTGCILPVRCIQTPNAQQVYARTHLQQPHFVRVRRIVVRVCSVCARVGKQMRVLWRGIFGSVRRRKRGDEHKWLITKSADTRHTRPPYASAFATCSSMYSKLLLATTSVK
jgi:hypothetical protein